MKIENFFTFPVFIVGLLQSNYFIIYFDISLLINNNSLIVSELNEISYKVQLIQNRPIGSGRWVLN
jgi:hypothetical protein